MRTHGIRFRDVLAHLTAFMELLIRRFLAHKAPQQAASLAYTSLLSLVPLMTVVFAIFSAFPIAEQVGEVVQGFVFENFVPASGEVVQRYLSEFSGKAGRLTGVSFITLMVVALMLMGTIDRTLNTIWEVTRPRKWLNQFLVYWAVLSLGPVLIGASLLATSYLISLPLLSDAARSGFGQRMLTLAPILTSALGFSLLYLLVPNRRVRLSHALAGGVIAALLFEFTKRGFGIYITNFPTYEAIYGALATVPIFLIWIYLSWLVVLFGAEFTHCLGLYRGRGAGVQTAGGRLSESVRILRALALAQEAGVALSAPDLDGAEGDAESLLQGLQRQQMVERTEEGYWVLARNPATLSLLEIYRGQPERLALPGEPGWPEGDPVLAERLQLADAQLERVLAVSLRDISGEPAKPKR